MKNDNIHISFSLFWLDRPRKNQSERTDLPKSGFTI